MSHSASGEHHGSGGHEKRDVTFRPIVLASAVFAVVVVLVFLLARSTLIGMGAYEAKHSAPAHPLASTAGRLEPPEPRLQTHPVQDLVAMKQGQEAILNSYAWVDETRGVVRLPIARAMELIAQRGLPARDAAEPMP